MRRGLTMMLVVMALFCVGGCASKVVWKERVATNKGKTPIPTCPHCGEYADWESDRCKNPDCDKSYRWWEPEELQ